SAERFQERKMAFEVAINFLKSPNRPYEILDQIASQATTRPELASLWTDDPKAKLKASPKEMIKFAIFMRQTEHACKKIKDTPVFLVQGLKDALVKPTGTARMLLNIPCSDKDMFIIGEAEHLIIESDKQNPLFIGTLLSWLDNHLEPKADTQE
ncbi:MAG: alpha/beta hydrolase, partial [Candidatus Obscuribacterales bacterium]|nr:alpha/beta hydrolase [Candidatus Obscuribacterales bacterium]